MALINLPVWSNDVSPAPLEALVQSAFGWHHETAGRLTGSAQYLQRRWMNQSSPELLAITRRFVKAVLGRDSATLISLFSNSDHMRYVGSAENEIWGGVNFREGYARHNLEIPDNTHREVLVEAFEIGEFGWALYCAEIQFLPVEQPFFFRITLVFALESGLWKISQAHVSTVTPNLEIMGIEHNALDALIEAAESDFHPDGHEDTATVMFTDVADSSAIAASLGDRIWASAIQRHLDAVSATIADNGGNLVKSLGDGTMSTFASARSAMNAAIEIQTLMANADHEPKLRLRIGIHTGDVIQAKGDFFGTVVNKAARIAGAAQPGEIRLSQATQIMVGESVGFTFSDAVTVTLKGLEGAHLIYRLEAG
jgi:class 3 adenylate cyclase